MMLNLTNTQMKALRKEHCQEALSVLRRRAERKDCRSWLWSHSDGLYLDSDLWRAGKITRGQLSRATKELAAEKLVGSDRMCDGLYVAANPTMMTRAMEYIERWRAARSFVAAYRATTGR
jgi:hypothetical protein